VKVLLTHGYFIAEDEKEQRIMRPYPPLGLLCVAAYLREQGMEVVVHDSTFSTRQALLAEIQRMRPGAIAIYVNLMTRRVVVDLIHAIRAAPHGRSTPIVLGGPETRHHDERFLHHGADVCVMGEGEVTAHEVLAALGSRGVHELHHVAGIAFKDGRGAIVRTAERDRIRDIDALPPPARHLIDLDRYRMAWKRRHGYSSISVSTMRGCPYTCRWCSRAVYGQSYRRRSPERVVEELDGLQRTHAPDRFWFVDDVFTISHRWLEAFATALERRGLRIAYECITRADRMNREVIDLLKRTGCAQVWIGAESGSQRVIDRMDRRVDVAQVRDMIRGAKAAGIGTGTFIMLGYPGETQDDIDRTVEHLEQSDPDQFTITVAYPIKGTEFHQEVAGSFSSVPDWATSSDRDQDLPRTYPRPYYTHAVRHVVNEVEWRKLWRRGRHLAALGRKVISLGGRAGMWWWRMRGSAAAS